MGVRTHLSAHTLCGESEAIYYFMVLEGEMGLGGAVFKIKVGQGYTPCGISRGESLSWISRHAEMCSLAHVLLVHLQSQQQYLLTSSQRPRWFLQACSDNDPGWLPHL